MAFFVYMLRCNDGSIYTGHTEDLENRLAQHASAYFPRCYTANRRPLHLLWSEATSTRLEALEAERQIKGWTRAKKHALAAGNWDLVSALAKSPTASQPPVLRQAQD